MLPSSTICQAVAMNMDCDFAPNETKPDLIGRLHQCQAESVGVVRAEGEYCLVAIRPIAAGERLFRIEGEETDCPSRCSVQIGENLHIDLQLGHTTEEILDRYFWRFMNHSCEPNALIRGEEVMARLDIKPWESVTFNYNTTEWDMAEPFICHCGSLNCLGKIRGCNHLTPPQRERLRSIAARHLLRHLSKEFPQPNAVPRA